VSCHASTISLGSCLAEAVWPDGWQAAAQDAGQQHNSQPSSAYSLCKDLQVFPLLFLSIELYSPRVCDKSGGRLYLFDLAHKTSHLDLCRSIFTAVWKVFDENPR
jgi:hypothetical protein